MKGSKSAPTSPLAISEGVDNIQEIDSSPHRYISPVPPPTRSPPVPLDRGHSGTGHYDIHSHEYFPSTPDRSLNHGLDSASPLHPSIIPATSPRRHGRTTKMGVPMTMFPPFEASPKSWPMPLPPSGDPPPVLNVEVPSLSSTPRGFVTVNSLEPKTKKRYSYSGPLTSTAVAKSGRIFSKVPCSGPLRPLPSHSHKPGQPHSPQGHTFTSPKTSPTCTPSKISPPRISELHKLPPPPLSATSSPVTASSASLIAHSAPLARHQGESSSLYASPLPPPPLGNVTRSRSMSGGTAKSQKQQRFKGAAVTQLAEVDEEESGLPSPHGQPQSGPSASRHQTGRSDGNSKVCSLFPFLNFTINELWSLWSGLVVYFSILVSFQQDSPDRQAHFRCLLSPINFSLEGSPCTLLHCKVILCMWHSRCLVSLDWSLDNPIVCRHAGIICQRLLVNWHQNYVCSIHCYKGVCQALGVQGILHLNHTHLQRHSLDRVIRRFGGSTQCYTLHLI